MASVSLNDPLSLRKLLSYNPETGLMRWLERTPDMFDEGKMPVETKCKLWNAKFAGRPAFTTVTHDGYLNGCLLWKFMRAQRVAWMLHHGAWPLGLIDHINRDRTDNRIANLRDVNPSINARNRGAPAGLKAVAGVRWVERRKKWAVQISRKGSNLHIGYYASEHDALIAKAAAEKAAVLDWEPSAGRVASF